MHTCYNSIVSIDCLNAFSTIERAEYKWQQNMLPRNGDTKIMQVNLKRLLDLVQSVPKLLYLYYVPILFYSIFTGMFSLCSIHILTTLHMLPVLQVCSRLLLSGVCLYILLYYSNTMYVFDPFPLSWNNYNEIKHYYNTGSIWISPKPNKVGGSCGHGHLIAVLILYS